MRSVVFAGALAACLVCSGAGVALAQKSGGVLKMYHRDNPPTLSIHETATNSTVIPMMGVFNNLVMYDQHVKQNSLAADDRNPSRLMVAIPIESKRGLAKLQGLLEEDWSPDVLAFGTKAAYFWIPEGLLESKLANTIMRTHGEGFTVRNWATISKLHALCESD